MSANLSASDTTHLASLPQRALLAILNIREWPARQRDRDVTDRVARQHGAHPQAGAYTKALLPPVYLARIAQVRSEARTAHVTLTLPWCDDGFRILPVDLHLSYLDRLRTLRIAFDEAVNEFLASYDVARDAARQTLGGLWRRDDYPSIDRLRAAFALETRLQPLPTGDDWRIDLPDTTVQCIRRDLKDRLADAHRLALADLHRRLGAVVTRMAETLSQPDRIFRDSLVGNIRTLCDLLPSLNIAGDPNLAALTRTVDQQLAGVDPARLRHDPAQRSRVAASAADIARVITARLATYTGSEAT